MKSSLKRTPQTLQVDATLYFLWDEKTFKKFEASREKALPIACSSVDGRLFFAQIETIPIPQTPKIAKKKLWFSKC
jgi:hypothetical protein